MSGTNFDTDFLSFLNEKVDKLLVDQKNNSNNQNEVTTFLNDVIFRLHERKKKSEVELSVDAQAVAAACLQILKVVNHRESFKVAKVCQVWEHVLQLPNVVLTAPAPQQLVDWLVSSLQFADELIILDIMSCLAVAVCLKEVKQVKAIERVISSSGLLGQKTNAAGITDLKVLYTKILCNFTHCPGEKDWSSISKDLILDCIEMFTQTLESHLNADPSSLNFVKTAVFCFHGLENIFVRFQSLASNHLDRILGLAKSYIMFCVPGHSLKYAPIQPSSVPFAEFSSNKQEQGKTPKLRKKRPPSKSQSKNRNQESSVEDSCSPQSKNRPAIDHWGRPSSSAAVWSSSDSELSDSDEPGLQRLKEAQARVRSCALKMLSAAFKFCDQRTVMSYWSAFLPDSSQSHVFRHSLITPILKDSSIKVRCSALVALSSLLLAVQPTLGMASYQEKRTGAFIPFSQTLAETVMAVQRSLLLSLSAEQSVGAFIQLFKCLSVAASVFPYSKLPGELVAKTVQQCIPFLEFRDPDVKVACLSVLRVLLCTHSCHSEFTPLFWDVAKQQCWLLDHSLKVIANPSSGFPLTLESLLVIGEVTRCNVQFARPYLTEIVHSICRKMVADHDPGVQIRCVKSLSLVCSSVLQEMEKDDHEQSIARDDAVQLWIHILRHGVAPVLQSEGSSTPLRAEACAALATVGTQIFECLPRELRILFATLALGCATDADPSVRAAAIRTLGFAVTFNTLNDDASFLLDSSEHILLSLQDSNILVALNASWALGNLADTLDKDTNCLMDELPRNFLINLIRAAVQAAQGPIKVRCNGIRALGIFLKICASVPAEGEDTAVLLDQAISCVTKQVTTGNFMKNRWNACYACGNILQNVTLLAAYSHWLDKLVDSLLHVFRNCPNFKVRISAANALLHLNQRELLGNHFVRVWVALLDSLANSEQIDDFSEFQHHETMCRQICNTLCKLVTLLKKDDLSQLHETVIKYYDIFSGHFQKFLKSLLPDQHELVIEASNYIRLLGQSALTASQKAVLNLLQELLIIPI